MGVCISVHVLLCIYVCVCVYVCMCVCLYVCMFVYVCVCACKFQGGCPGKADIELDFEHRLERREQWSLQELGGERCLSVLWSRYIAQNSQDRILTSNLELLALTARSTPGFIHHCPSSNITDVIINWYWGKPKRTLTWFRHDHAPLNDSWKDPDFLFLI